MASAQVKKTFTPRFSDKVNGDITIIANNVLSRHATNAYNGERNSDYFSDNIFVDIDNDNNTFNSSSATLVNPSPSSSCLTFRRAYIYWVAANKEYGTNGGGNQSGNGGSEENWNFNQIKFMLPGSSSYQTITADEIIFNGRAEHFENDAYICVKDITSDVQGLADPYGKFQVANVKATEGNLYSHRNTHPGTSGGWQIVFIYESLDLPGRNITLFDGYANVTRNTNNFDIDFNGFQTVPNGPVKANITIGALEGDRGIDGDKLLILDTNGTWATISTSKRAEDNFFNSKITVNENDFITRNPASLNTLGYDASVFSLKNNGNELIGNDQTTAKIRMTSDQEAYGLYLLGLSVEVYEPSLGALHFTTSLPGTNYNAGDNVQLSISMENSGNDNIENLEISTILPIEVDFVDTQTLPTGVTHSFNTTTRELKFFVQDGITDIDDPAYSLDFNVQVKDQCYFLETACSTNFQIQAIATFTGATNKTELTTYSSGTLDSCGLGNHNPTVVGINQPDQVNWNTAVDDLNRTISCDDTTSLNNAQALEPATEFCNFTLNKTSGAFVPNAGCDAEGTYTNTWVFTDACGRVSDSFTQIITIEDNTDPNFNETVPSDTVAAYDNIPSPAILTANDTCDSNPQVIFNETYNGDNNGTIYTIIRTWTASDCAGNTTEHTQNIYVTENGDPIGLAINDVSVNENNGTATFNVTLTGITSTSFTVNYSNLNGTAQTPVDYDIITGSLNFNGTHGEEQTVVVNINDDSIVETPETYSIELSGLSTNETSINDVSGLGTILDNDSASVSIIDLDVIENAGIINVEVFLSGNVEESFAVDFTTANGSALSGTDYNNNSGQLTFPANSTNGNIQNIAITINDDTLIEATENFLVGLSNITASGSISIADNQANVNILDNDAIAGTGIAFDDTEVTVDEAAGTATFTVRLTGNVPGGFTLDYGSANGSAVAPGDYTAVSGTLAFTGNDNESYDIIVPIIDDALIEATEGYVIDLSNLSTVLIGINTPQANGGITDNDGDSTIGVQFDVTSININEDVGTVSLNVTLNANVQDEFTVDFNSTNASAINPADYSTVSGTLTFGGTNSNTQSITVDIFDDIIIEDTENFQVVLSNISTSLVNILSNSTMTVNILDNDGNEGYPTDITLEACETIPDAVEITSNSTCAISVVFEEIISGDEDSCPTEYIITRTWTITDCVGNERIHTQVIAIEDTIAPTFVEALPKDMMVTCDEIPDAAVLTALDNCDANVTVTFDETTTNNGNCSIGYVITRVWNTTDCAGNATTHAQTITVMSNGPIISSDYEEELTIMCGELIPEVPNLTFMGGCGDYIVDFNEIQEFSDTTEDFMIVRTWNVTDACDNMATFEQLIFVMQPEKETVTINICVEDMTIDLFSYLPIDFDTNGVFTVTIGSAVLNGSFFDPIDNEVGEHTISYSSTEGTCKYYVDFVINVNTDCVPCGRKDIQPSKTVTPNGDGINDYFEIKGVENCDFTFDVMIFNRWGAKVYEGVNYMNDWDGSSPNNSYGNSGMLPTGTYYYILKVTNRDFEPTTGYIYLGTK